MWVQKIKHFDIVCPHCGTKISLTNDEYLKYRKETEDYNQSTILCQKEDENGKEHDIEYTNFDCPVCKGYIPVTVADGENSDIYGFCYSVNVSPVYGNYEQVSIDDYINGFFNDDLEESEG